MKSLLGGTDPTTATFDRRKMDRVKAHPVIVGKPVWFTIPESMDYGRIIVCELMLDGGRRACYTQLVNRFELVYAEFLHIVVADKIRNIEKQIKYQFPKS